MDRVCLVLPNLPEKAADARALQEVLDGPRKSEYAASERSIGIDKEVGSLRLARPATNSPRT